LKPAPFAYARPTTVNEAAALLADAGEGARCLAGGQTLLAMLNMRVAEPSLLVDLGAIPGLDRIATEGSTLVVGAGATHRAVEASEEARAALPILALAARHIAHPTIRNRGTIGGSLCHADPAAEWPLVAVLLDARLRLASAGGTREVPARAFFAGPLETVRRPDEILTEIVLPLAGGRQTFGFHEMSRRAGDFAIVAAACRIGWSADGVVASADLAIGGAGPVPYVVDASALIGGRLEDEAIAGLGETASAAADPSSDVHASAAYRRTLVRVLARRALVDAREGGTVDAVTPICAPPETASRAGIMPTDMVDVRLEVNGRPMSARVAARRSLADFLRVECGLTGTRLGCEHGVCGACTVHLDGRTVRACLTLAAQADGGQVGTVEGLAEAGELSTVQQAFWEHHALQCGFCTSGMLMTATELMATRPDADEAAVRDALSGNLCRCTGYANIVAAVMAALGERR
jgi:CO/xanthine dehydrogenase FAD-binding subunit/aerobic-type carbon monoxide dehydrogenase small subunit (CoxS/CutS family)